jgi:nicotinate phosphoribosyltransferase
MFTIIDDHTILDGLSTDVYFLRTEEVLEKKRVNPKVVAEVTAPATGILSGVEDVARLLKGKQLDVYAMQEGTLFYPKEPVLYVEGHYLDFARYETSILGFLCHASGIATKAFKIKAAAGEKRVVSFGSRRQHPCLAGVIEKNAYLGGMDGVSNYAGAQLSGLQAEGTMPHALIICFGEQIEAWRSFDEVMPKEIPRICLCDTYADEKTESILACNNISDLFAVRLDTPSSRRGDFKAIISEVRWEMDIRGYRDVKIFISGGLDEEDVRDLRDAVDGFGVGSKVASAPPVDFAMDIVEKDGEFVAKRGKLGGKKQIYRDWSTLSDTVIINGTEEKFDLNESEPLLLPVLQNGNIVADFELEKARELVLSQLKFCEESFISLKTNYF